MFASEAVFGAISEYSEMQTYFCPGKVPSSISVLENGPQRAQGKAGGCACDCPRPPRLGTPPELHPLCLPVLQHRDRQLLKMAGTSQWMCMYYAIKESELLVFRGKVCAKIKIKVLLKTTEKLEI